MPDETLPATWWNLAAMILVRRGLLWSSQFGYQAGATQPGPHAPTMCRELAGAVLRMRTMGFVADPRYYPRRLELTGTGERALYAYLGHDRGLSEALRHSLLRADVPASAR